MFCDVYCEYPFNRIRVKSNGDVSFCNHMMLNGKDSIIGNVLENNFDEVWFGEKAERIRMSVLNGELHSSCNCKSCPYSNSKKLIPRNIVYNEYPNFLEIELPNTHCNIGKGTPSEDNPACIMCHRSSPDFKEDQGSIVDVLSKLKNITFNLYQIHFDGFAEPFYKENEDNLVFECLKALGFKNHKDQIYVFLMTNGLLLDNEVVDRYLKYVPNSYNVFSMDASTSETYKQLRISDDFDQLVDNMTYFSIKRSKNQKMIIHNNINVINVDEVVGMVDLAHEMNVDCIEFIPTTGFNREIQVNSKNCGVFNLAQFKIIESCHNKKVNYKFIRNLDDGIMDKLVQICI